MSGLNFHISASCYIFQTLVFRFLILDFNFRFSAFRFHVSEFSFELRGFIFHLSVYRFQLSDLNFHICCWGNQASETGGTTGETPGEPLERSWGNPPGHTRPSVFVWGTIGETHRRHRGNPPGRQAAPSIKSLYKNPLGKPS